MAEPPSDRGERGLVGRTLGSYRVLESLGSGGMGQVYLAEHAMLSRRVALKVLPPDMASHPEKIARFEREAKAVASLSHPGIVTLYTIEEADGIRFLTMEHVEGETLSKQIPPRGFAMERLLSLAIALADAVSAAHRQGVLHRDLKPENIMLAADGRLKVLDFGLAKLRYDSPDEDDKTTRETQSVTQDGRIVGTVAYMSPEQAQGLPVDSRSDIFTLGILLYEMATGERPFRGNTNMSVLSSILKDSPRPVSELRDDIPKPLARMIQRALEKRPEDRYQSASDLRRDLEDLKRDVDTGELVMASTAGRQRLVAPPPRRRRWALPAAIGAALVVVAAMAVLFFRGQPLATAGDGRRSVAVFYFDNLTGDPQLDWLRTGLTDMLVTNLSQSPGLRVLGTSRLYQLLDETGHRDDRTMSAPIVASVARKAQTGTALVGSFVRAGSQLRIQASLQDPKSGEVIASERVEGNAESGLFALVDELTGRLRKRLEAPSMVRLADRRHGSWKEKKLEEVTTSSMEAFKAYLEGSRLHDRLQEKEAQAYFEKAVRADPGFAMALAKLSIVQGNLGNVDKARAYSAKALEKAVSLPPAERYYIEGRHYSLDPATIEKAIAAYQKAVDEAPHHTAARNNLAQLLLEMQRYPEALVHLEELRRRGMTFPGSYMSLAQAEVATGHPDRARQALAEYAAEHPDRAAGYENLGYFELTQDRIDAALAAFDKAAALHPPDPIKVELGRFVAHALRDDWKGAEAAARRLQASDEPRARWEGGASLAMASLYRGDVGEARRLAEEGAVTGRTSQQRVGAHLFRARIETDLGRHREALAEADRAISEKAAEPKLVSEGHAVRALCLARLGRQREAEKSQAEVNAFLATIPPTLGKPMRLHLQGELALARGDHAQAREMLKKAAALAPVDTLTMDPGPVLIHYGLARTALEEGDLDEARVALRKVVEAGPPRVSTPIPYVRSLALLASLEERSGRSADARRLYERYLGYWKDGQIDRAEVARAGQRLAALRPRPAA
jgi:tetratricopeptide (TPR) repeat protein/tRNA A-37 threonylcarbamoyl transferase component Bud32